MLGYKPDVLVLDPHDLDDILISIMDIGERVGRIKEARRIVLTLQKRMDYIIEKSTTGARIHNQTHRPKVLCIEWIDPFYSAGHWVPQMVDIAGGINGISSRGNPSRCISMQEIMQFQPDKIVLMPCGFDLDRTLRESKILWDDEEWNSLLAVRENEVYAVNATEYFSKPGPRVIIGLEILAKITNPVQFYDLGVPQRSFKRIRKPRVE
jgi:iron complex transport system substrate-binding protein